LLVLSFFVGVTTVLLESSATALFLSVFGMDELPYAFIAAAVLVASLGFAYSRLEQRLSFGRLLMTTARQRARLRPLAVRRAKYEAWSMQRSASAIATASFSTAFAVLALASTGGCDDTKPAASEEPTTATQPAPGENAGPGAAPAPAPTAAAPTAPPHPVPPVPTTAPAPSPGNVPAAAPGAAPGPAGAEPPAAPSTVSGTVVETMNSGGYTYALIDTGTKKVWAAAPGTQVAVGDKASFTSGALMKGFHSRTLNRSFDEIYFVSGFGTGSKAPKAGHPTMKKPHGHP
jgi:hypothetical protein